MALQELLSTKAKAEDNAYSPIKNLVDEMEQDCYSTNYGRMSTKRLVAWLGIHAERVVETLGPVSEIPLALRRSMAE